jgi:Leucine-rich repeat (LRR) protein
VKILIFWYFILKRLLSSFSSSSMEYDEDISPIFPDEIWILIFRCLAHYRSGFLFRFSTISKRFHSQIINDSITTLFLDDYNENDNAKAERIVKFLNFFDNEKLKNFRYLHSLRLHQNQIITDDCLKSLTFLKSLGLSQNNMITNESVKYLTNLTVLSLLENSMITNDIFQYLSRNLTWLCLARNNLITDKGISHLTNLTFIGLNNNKMITGTGLRYASKMKELSLYTEKFNDNAFYSLVRLTSLSIYRINGITDVSLMTLTNLY